MKFYRYMSFREFRRLMVGERLINHTVHRKDYKTGSLGFCFLAEQVEIEEASSYTRDEAKFNPERIIDFERASFILQMAPITRDVLVEFDPGMIVKQWSHGPYIHLRCDTGVILRKVKGLYNNPIIANLPLRMVEYSTTCYSLQTMNPVRFQLMSWECICPDEKQWRLIEEWRLVKLPTTIREYLLAHF